MSRLWIRCKPFACLLAHPFLSSSCSSSSIRCSCSLPSAQPVRYQPINNTQTPKEIISCKLFSLRSFRSYRYCSASFSTFADVSVSQPAMHQRNQVCCHIFFLLHWFHWLILYKYVPSKISFGICGRFTGAELLSFSMALTIVCVWILTGHWLLMDGNLLQLFISPDCWFIDWKNNESLDDIYWFFIVFLPKTLMKFNQIHTDCR